MAQYVIFTDGIYVTYTDGVDIFRDGSRGGAFVTDQTLTTTGFAGAENTDWINVDSNTNPLGLNVFRDGVRDGCYVKDQTLTGTGFSGVESLDNGVTNDWVNLEKTT